MTDFFLGILSVTHLELELIFTQRVTRHQRAIYSQLEAEMQKVINHNTTLRHLNEKKTQPR